MFKELFSSFTDTAEERMNSSMYGSFIISWCLWNWKFLYVTFFVDQEKILSTTNQLKIDYILGLYPFSSWLLGLLSFAHLLLLPAFFSYIIVFQLSKLEEIFFKKSLGNQYSKRRAIELEEKKLLKSEQEKLKTKTENLNLERNIESELSNEEKWDIEYDDIKNDDFFKKAMDFFKKVVYQNYGDVHDAMRYSEESNLLAFLDVNGLMKFKENNTNRIESTEKGKYFLKKFLNKSTRPA